MAVTSIYDRIRAARVLANLSQDELAERLGVSAATVKRREYGESAVNAEVLMALAQATDVPLAWIVDGFTDEQIGQPLDATLARIQQDGTDDL